MKKDELISLCVQKALEALDSNIVNITSLMENCGGASIKERLDNLNKSRATQALAIASLIAKIKRPDWDTRLHQARGGGYCGLRTISGKVNALLYSKGLLPTPMDYALLGAAFKGVSAPFNKEFKGNIKPEESLPALLSILELINTTATSELLMTMLQYILSYLKSNKEKNDQLKNTQVVSLNGFTISDVTNTLNKLDALGDGSSKLPVIAVFTLVSIIQSYLWANITILPLKEHTEADKDRSCGDVEAVNSDNKTIIAIEIKHKLNITDTVIQTFHDKTSGKEIPLTFILSTKPNTVKKYVKDDIGIDTVNGFVSTYLQMALFHEKKICSIFLHKLRENIVNETNLDLTIKELSNEILTSLLVSPSL